MSWKVMTPVEVCDLMEFWNGATWPLTREEVQRLATERFGWTIEVEDDVPYLMNTVSGFTIPDVSTIGSEGALSYLSLRVSDVIREVTAESTAFLGDNFALMVREGEARWGRPTMGSVKETSSASWDTPTGARIIFSMAPKSLSAMFLTPQGAELDRKSGY